MTNVRHNVGPCGDRYLNARLKNYVFLRASTRIIKMYVSDAWKRAKVCSIQRRFPDAFITRRQKRYSIKPQ
jgi:hypothetical protein